jgi:hypothetical protein
MDKNRLSSSSPTRHRAPTDLSAESTDSQSNAVGFQPAAADFLPLRPASPPLSTGQNGESRDHCFAESGRPNSIYVTSGSSGPIFTFLFNLNFIQQNGPDLKKFLHQCS